MKFNLWSLDDHPELVEALFAAHRKAAIANDNASKLCVQQAWGGSGRFESAIIAGMATIGALHAPLVAARELWESSALDEEITSYGWRGGRVPGFGNSFHTEDPAFSSVNDAIWHYDDARARLVWISWLVRERVFGRNVDLRPNAALYTAIVASICQVPRGLEPALFAIARIPAWAEICGATQHPKIGGML